MATTKLILRLRKIVAEADRIAEDLFKSHDGREAGAILACANEMQKAADRLSEQLRRYERAVREVP